MKIYQSIKELVTSQRLEHAASVLSEKGTNVASAVSQILPAILSKLHSKGATAVKETIDLAEKHNLYSHLNQIWEGNGIVDHLNIGERLENNLFSPGSKEFNTSIAAKSGVSYESADRLTNWVSATVAAWFAHTAVKEKKSLAILIKELGNEKDIFGVTAHHTAHKPAPAPKKKSLAWLWWLLGLIILALIAFFCIRSCNRKKAETIIETVIDPKFEIKKQADALKTKLLNEYNVKDQGTEIQMIDYLISDEYDLATADQLKNKWFHFDHIDFEHNSAVEMMPGAKAQLDNIAMILTHFKDAKIMIAGYADKTGSVAINEAISKARAEYVKKVFADHGIAANRISTEGFGKEFATHPVTDPDAERAIDRHFALRFFK